MEWRSERKYSKYEVERSEEIYSKCGGIFVEERGRQSVEQVTGDAKCKVLVAVGEKVASVKLWNEWLTVAECWMANTDLSFHWEATAN